MTYHFDIIQGTPEWHNVRRGALTSTAIKTLITPTGKLADNDKVRAHVYEIAAQRINGRTDDTFQSFDMMRGQLEEVRARELYIEHFAPVRECGFLVGYSPDGLVGDDGIIEIKSAKSRIQVERIANGLVPNEHVAQIQTGLWVTGREWCDFISFSNGMPMQVLRVYANTAYHALIEQAAKKFEADVQKVIADYREKSAGMPIAEYMEALGDGDIQGSDE
jgi:hypothetical protein